MSPYRLAIAALALTPGCGPSVNDDPAAGTTGASDDAADDDDPTASGSTSLPGTSTVGTSTTTAGTSTTTTATTVTTADTTDDTTDASTGDCVDPDPELCPLPGTAFADVDGTTPLGDFTGAFAWSGWLYGECGGIVVYITPTIEDFADDLVCLESFAQPTPSLRLTILEGTRPMCLAASEAPITILQDGMEAEAAVAATVAIDECTFPMHEPDAPGYIVGTFTIESDGWSIGGSFVAPYCENLNIYCP